jgi:serine protease Do
MGLSIQDITSDLAAALKLGQTRGALVGDVDPKGPAARTGIQSGDVIVEANSKPVAGSRELLLMVSSMAPGSQLNLRVSRGGQGRNVTLTLVELPIKETASAAPAREKPSPAPEPDTPRIGIAVSEVTPEIAEILKVPATTKGIVVADIEEGSAAAEAKLQPGDIIQEINRKPVRTIEEFQSHIASRGKDPLLLLVNRDGHTMFIALEPQ